MIYAAFNGHYDIVRLLAESNANVNLQDKVCVWCCFIKMRKSWQ